jgi:Na+/H+ antiporter 1
MATDIAFAVGVLSLLGDRVPNGARIFLLTLAIADDIGAIVVIAIFYTDALSSGWLAAAVGGLVLVALLRSLDIRALAPYIALGGWVWLALLESGVHATLAGVALALLTPAWSFHDPRRFTREARRLVDQVDAPFADNVLTADELEHTESALADLNRLTTETRSPLERPETRLAPWTAFVVVPMFALANAGIPLSARALADAVSDPVTAGVALGLVLGKPIGIGLATLAATRLGIGALPPRYRMGPHHRRWHHRRHWLHGGPVRRRPELRRPGPDRPRQDRHHRSEHHRRARGPGGAPVGWLARGVGRCRSERGGSSRLTGMPLGFAQMRSALLFDEVRPDGRHSSTTTSTQTVSTPVRRSPPPC